MAHVQYSTNFTCVGFTWDKVYRVLFPYLFFIKVIVF